MGVTTFRAKPPDTVAKVESRAGLFGAYLSMLFYTLTNPMTILSFGMIFASLGAEDPDCLPWLAVGVPIGSAIWWLILSSGVGLLRERVTPPVMMWINRVVGVLLLGFGLAALWGVIAV
jgi:threonine/homoserine/homoserine lactone efflux protein